MDVNITGILNHRKGTIENGKKSGKGTFYFASGNKYVGDWVEDNRTGQGVLTYTNGDRYER